MNRPLIALFVGFLAPGCSTGSPSNRGEAGGEDDSGGTVVGEGDPSSITIEIESPDRGTLSDSSQIMVVGRATSTAGAIETVKVNGAPARLADDGRFQAPVSLVDGITLVETVARDAAGNEAIDSRGVMAGTLVDQATPVVDGIVANLSSHAMAGLTSTVSDLANSIDFTSLITNPVVDTGDGCNTAEVFVESIDHGGVTVDATNIAGGLDVDISITDLVVAGRVEIQLGIGGPVCGTVTVDFTLTAASCDVGGTVVPSLTGGDISVAVDGVTSTFADFTVNVDNLPEFIENLFQDDVRDALAGILSDQVTEMVPPAVNAFLGDFLGETVSLSVLGQTIDLSITPTAMDWTEQGGTIALDTSATVAGVEGARYLSSPRPRPSDADLASTGLRIALADDVLNQLLASIWASGALEQTMLPVPGDALSAAFGAEVGSAAVTLLLPPVANFDTTTGTARLTIGDLLLEAVGPNGEPLASFVLSAEIDLAVRTGSDGKVRIITHAPRILAQVLSQSDTLATPLTNDLVAAIAELGITQISLFADDLLENLPVPGIAGATITSPTLQPAGGYLLLGGTLTFE